MDKKSVEAFLKKVLSWEKSIKQEQARLHRLEEKMEYIALPNALGMRYSGGKRVDAVACAAQQREQYQKEMAACYEKIETYKAAVCRLHRLLYAVLEEKERNIILWRCGEGMNWTQIVIRCNYARSHCFRKYNHALEALGEIFEEELAQVNQNKKVSEKDETFGDFLVRMM